jgi:hypothetical protein
VNPAGSLSALLNVAWVVVTLLQIILLLRLWQQELLAVYRWFGVYLAVSVAQAIVLSQIETGTDTYAFVYLPFAAVMAVLALLVILEVYSLVLRQYIGIGSVGRWAIGGALAIAVTVSAVSVRADLSNSGDLYPILFYTSVILRAVYSALLLFMVGITLFVVWFPIPLPYNTILHTMLFAVRFCGSTLVFLARNFLGASPETVNALSTGDMFVHSLCLIGWILFLRREGEQRTAVFGHRWRPEETAKLVGQLDAINNTLLRTARK